MVVATSPDSPSTKQYKTLEHCYHWASGMPLFQRIRFESANLRILGWNAQTSKSWNPSKTSECVTLLQKPVWEFGATWCSGGAMFQLIVWFWSSFHLLASMTSRPLLAMHALAKQLQPRMCYTLIHLDSLNKWGLTKIVDKAHKRCFRDFRVSYSNCVAVFFVLALAADQWKGAVEHEASARVPSTMLWNLLDASNSANLVVGGNQAQRYGLKSCSRK